MNQLNKPDILPLIGRDIPYSVIDKEILLVRRFGSLSKVMNGIVKPLPSSPYYGFLEVEGATFSGTAMLPLVHKDDYLHVWQAHEDRGIKSDEEMLVVWTNTNYKNLVFSALKSAMPKIIVWVCPKDAYRVIHEKDYMPELSGEARYRAQAAKVEIKPEVML